MFRELRLIPVLLAASAVATLTNGATLQQLSMDQMSQLATSVVRARVTGVSASLVATAGSPTIYTHYKLVVNESLKGAAATEVVLPGGEFNGQKQSFPGVPELKVGSEYVLFLWKSPTTGVTHSLGLTQGIFEIRALEDGSLVASRKQSGELMLDASGKRVNDQAVSLKLGDLRTRVRQAPAATGIAK
jgi:hypothetical protein